MNIEDRRQLEGQFLSSLIDSNNKIPEYAGTLAPADLEVYPKIYADILSIYQRDGRVKVLCLPTDREDVGQFVGLWADHAQPELLPSITRRILEDNQRSRIRRLCQTFITKTDDPEKDVGELTASFLSEAQSACQERREEDGGLDAAARLYFEDRKRPNRRISTGIPGLDKLLDGGFALGTYTCVGGYTSNGKSFLGSNLAYTAARQGRKVAVVSFEMGKIPLYKRLLSIHSGVPDMALQGSDLKNADRALRALPIRLFCGGRKTGEAIAMLARREKMRAGLDLLIIDYIQQVHSTASKNANPNEKLTQISATLQDLAQSQDVALVALSQLNRSGARENKPSLWALRDSGSLEQDADHVILLQKDPKNEDLLSLNLAKNRHGRCGLVDCRFDREGGRILEVTA
jgi:replicative DNA helicase